MRKNSVSSAIHDTEYAMLHVLAEQCRKSYDDYRQTFAAMYRALDKVDEIYCLDRKGGIERVEVVPGSAKIAYGDSLEFRKPDELYEVLGIENYGKTWAFQECVMKKALQDRLLAEAEARKKREDDIKTAQTMASMIKERFDIGDKRLEELLPYFSMKGEK